VRNAAGRGKPIVAIGGITLDRAPSVIASGAAAVAVITDLLTSGDPETRARHYLRVLA
jgi:thiamine-phosphate pyrophosphorylase